MKNSLFFIFIVFLHFFLVLPFLHSTSKLLKHITFILPVNQKLRQKYSALWQGIVLILSLQGRILKMVLSVLKTLSGFVSNKIIELTSFHPAMIFLQNCLTTYSVFLLQQQFDCETMGKFLH